MSKNIRLNSTHYFIMKLQSKQELQQIALHHPIGIEVKDFINLYKKCTAKPYFLVLLLHQIILYVLQAMFEKEYKN